MIDAFGVEISKGVPIKGQLSLFPLKGMTRAKRSSSFGDGGRSPYKPKPGRQEKQIKGQTFLSSQKAGGKEFKIVSPKPPKTNDDIALSPEGQKFLEFRLKRLDREYAGRFASSGPKVSRKDPTDELLNSQKAESVSRLSGRQRVGKSDAFGVERTDISKGLPSYIRQAVHATPGSREVIKKPFVYADERNQGYGMLNNKAVSRIYGEKVSQNTKKYPEIRARELKFLKNPTRKVEDAKMITNDIERRSAQHLEGRIRSAEISANRSENNGSKLVLVRAKKRPFKNI